MATSVEVGMKKLEHVWEFKEFTATFPNVFEAKAGQAMAEKFKQIPKITPDHVFEIVDYTEYATTSAGIQRKILCRIQATLESQSKVIGMNTCASSDDLQAIYGGKGRKGVIKMAVSLIDKNGNMLFNGGIDTNESKWPLHGVKGADSFSLPLPTLQELWMDKEKYFPDDSLRLKYEFWFLIQDQPQPYDYLPKAVSILSSDMLNLFRNGTGSDFIIKCGSTEFPVHQSILGARSPVFAGMFAVNMKEKSSKLVEVKDIEPEVMHTVLEYSYSSIFKPTEFEFGRLCELATAAEKYQLLELKAICFQYMADNVEPDTAGLLTRLAHMLSAPSKVLDQLQNYCAENFNILRENEDFKTQTRQMSVNFYEQLEFLNKYAQSKTKK